MTDFFDRISSLSPKRLALLAHELNEKLMREQAKTRQPIAIVGLAFRLPGADGDPDRLWRHLLAGDDLIGPAPSDRWGLDQPVAGLDGTAGGPRGGYLPRIDQFDPLFFGISPREAEMMDPQQRLLLEVAWEALEDSAIAPASLRGSRTGVFAGIAGSDFARRVLDQDAAELDSHMASGGSNAIAAGRLSYTLGLEGPCVSMDTACSSSLVAISAACDSLRLGRSDLALAGGVSLILSPETTIVLAKAGMLSPGFRCRSFDAGADGFVRGEGCGVVVLKRLSDAERDGDRVMAVIRGTAVNQDGRSSGLTAPSGPAQRSLMRDALADAGVEPARVRYVEAHGTGTNLGDPIEAQALAAVFGADRPPDSKLWLGSIKANFGHLEAAAGAAGLIKLILSIEHGIIPPLAGLTTPNPHVDWDGTCLALPTRPMPWPGAPSDRIGGVSSFGFSGTNAHLVVSAPPPSMARELGGLDPGPHLLCVSAKSPSALRALAARHVDYLDRHPDVALADFCHTANAGRDHHAERLAIIGQDVPGSRARLAAAAAGTPRPPAPEARRIEAPGIAFLFTGQGSQYPGMARALYETEPGFAATIDRCDEILAAVWGHGLKTVLFSDTGAERLNRTEYTQPALFAIEVALAQLLISWGVRPGAVMGHSVGEYAAACVAGVFSLEDGLKLIAARARLMQSLPPGGGMVAVLAAEADVARTIAPFPGLAVAALNGPANVVVSGPLAEIDRLIRALDASGAMYHQLTVSHAFHSALMDPMLDALEREADGIPHAEPAIPIISNLTGRRLQPGELRGGAYWCAHARKPVRFADGMRALRALDHGAFVEIGPAPILLGMARRVLADPDILWLPTLKPGRGDLDQLLESVGKLYESGIDLDFAAMARPHARRKLSIPTYPFEKSRYWPRIKPRAANAAPAPEACRDWLYDLEWRPSPGDAAAVPAPGYIPDTGLLGTAIEERLAASYRAHPGGDDDRAYEEIDRLCRDYIVEALCTLGCALRIGDVFSTDALRGRLGVLDRHGRLFARLMMILAEDGILESDGKAWRVARVPEERLRIVTAELPQFATELAVLEPCGARLAEVLRGECDPMQLLFPGGSLDAVTELYSEPRPVRVFNGLIERCIEAVVGNLPPDRHLGVLEVGGGTGGTTARILRHFPPERTRYRFTDVSRQFLDRARARFKDHDFIDYALFDLDNPGLDNPAADMAGLEGGADIVIAANVVHATRDLRRSLGTLRRCLRPGGLLVLLEVVRPQRLGDLTVGLTDGWWAFEDHDIRPDYALVTGETWTRILDQTGFVGALAAPALGGGSDRLLSNQRVILAKRGPDAESPSAAARQDAAGRWLIFADRGGLGRDLAARLRARGGACLIVHPGDDYRDRGGDIEIRPVVAADHARVVETFVQSDPKACRGVVYLWGLDAVFRDDDGPAAVLGAVEAACRPGLVAIQAMAATGWRGGGLTVATRGGRSTERTRIAAHPAQAALWGMVGTAALEHPELGCRRIDLSGGGEAEGLLEELLRNETFENEIALTPDGRRVLRLERSPSSQGVVSPPRLRADGAYLVTGGLTGLGLETARWLAEHGAGQLILVGRRAPDETARAAMARIGSANIAGLGKAPICLSGDIGDARDAERILAAVDATGLELAGVIHSAGIVSDASLLRQDWPRFEAVLRAKAAGAWNLHRLTRSRTLDFFVLYSSGAAILGSVGQANHAAANAFMDSLAFHRSALGLPALSINWAAWRDIGAAAGHPVLETTRQQGVDPIDVEGGLTALGRMMASRGVRTAVLPIDWARLDGPTRPILQDVRPRPAADGPKVKEATPSESVDWRKMLDGGMPALRKSMLRGLLEEEAARLLKLSSVQLIDPGQPLRDLGLDSLVSLEFRNSIAMALSVELPPTLLYNYPTIDLLTEHLLDALSGAAAPVAESEPRADPDDMSEEDLARLLEEQINLD